MDENTTQHTETSSPQVAAQRNNALAIPLAIIVGFGLIAAAIFFSGGMAKKEVAAIDPAKVIDEAAQQIGKTGPVRPIDESDHIRGNPNAPIVIVEYSDYDCPYCKNFHETMNQVMEKYGTSANIAWVYRHFPLEQRHPNAPLVAQASECVAEIGGNEAFWKFTDMVFAERGVNDPTDITRLNEFAVSTGVSGAAYDACMKDGRTKKAVEEDFADGVNAGARGTPYSLVLVGGQQGVINGAQPYEYVSSILDTLTAQLNGTTEAE